MRVAVVLAGGSGTRSGVSSNKVLVELAGVAVVRRSVDVMVAGGADRVVVVTRPADRPAVAAVLGGVDCTIVDGGPTRQRSEAAGIAAAARLGATGPDDVIAVHDAARPLVSVEVVASVFDGARAGAAYPAVERGDLWYRSADGSNVPSRPVGEPLLAAQTPQAARADLLVAAVAAAGEAAADATDTIDIVERYGPGEHRLTVVPGDDDNVKLTWPEDFTAAHHRLAGTPAANPGPVESSIVQPVDTPDADVEVDVELDADQVALARAEADIADAQIALDCLAVAGTEICAVCVGASADGSLAGRPALARCVAAKQG